MMRLALAKALERIAFFLIGCGGVIVLIQAFWITYGVFVRYVINDPDGMVTEATALLLVPVAFCGLAYALISDAYPKVTLLIDNLSPRVRGIIDRVNLVIMTTVGLFFSLAASEAAIRAYSSGAASEILLWPRFYFWIPVAISLYAFSLTAIAKILIYQAPTEAFPLEKEIL